MVGEQESWSAIPERNPVDPELGELGEKQATLAACAPESHPRASACWGTGEALASPRRNVTGSGKDSEV